MHPQPQSSLSSNTLFLSLPQPSLPSALSYNPSAYGGQTTNYLDSNASVQNWIVKQVRPTRLEDAVETSHGTSDVPSIFHSAWSDSWAYQLLPNETPVMLPKQTKINKPMRCEVCKIDCNSKSVFENHISGKKHKRNMQLQNSPGNTILSGTSPVNSQIQAGGIQGQELFVAVGKELESKKQKLLSGSAAVDSVRVCTICNIACNSQEIFSKHLAGKKHAAQVGLTSNNGIGPKKIEVTQPARCEICMIDCNSKDVYIRHLCGKKHLRNLEKLSKSEIAGAGAGTSVAGATVAIITANAMQQETNPVIEPQEKPDASKQEGINSHKPENAVMLEPPEKHIETKKRKRELVGGAATTSFKVCNLCNVVCNSETVFNSHLAGQKHAAMVKKQA